MKFNWGTGAFLLFGGFVIFMLGLVFYASQQKNDLVTEDYYEKELEFKDVLVKQELTEKLTEQLQIEVKAKALTLSFPKEVGHNISGKLFLFKPSNINDDKEISFTTDNSFKKVDLSGFSTGMYKLKVNWNAGEKEYYNEVEIVIE
ncbi:MAG: FixH family protein [Flavobacteriales bacterium]|nr:FixH family protein [Flavobacteriales bacterium]